MVNALHFSAFLVWIILLYSRDVAASLMKTLFSFPVFAYLQRQEEGRGNAAPKESGRVSLLRV